MSCSECYSAEYDALLVTVCCGGKACSDCYDEKQDFCNKCENKIRTEGKCDACCHPFCNGIRSPIISVCCQRLLCSKCYSYDQESCCIMCIVNIHAKNKRRITFADHTKYQRLFNCNCTILTDDEIESLRVKRNTDTQSIRKKRKLLNSVLPTQI